MAVAADALSESIMRTRSPSSEAAVRALSKVPERRPEMCTERIRSNPASSSYAARKSAGVGCDVVGSSLAVRRRA
jgi:hypothetical protein